MSFWQRLVSRLLGTTPSVDSTGVVVTQDAVWVYLRCEKCGEPIAVRLSKMSAIQREESKDYAWFVNKTVVGSKNRCFNRMELRLEFDTRYRLLRKELTGGTFIPKHEYEAAQR